MKRTGFSNKASAYHTYKIPTDIDKAAEHQVKNSAGGYVYRADKFDLLRRMLILGTKYGSYYITANDMTRSYAGIIEECIAQDYKKTFAAISEVYDSGMYLDEGAVIFALAQMCSSKDPAARNLASSMIYELRTGNAILHFCSIMDNLRGWGRAIRRELSSWYNREPSKVAYQILKYQSRFNWSHRDVLRKAHIIPSSDEHNILFSYIADGWGSDWYYSETVGYKGEPTYSFSGTVGNVTPKTSHKVQLSLVTNSTFLEQIAAYEKMKNLSDMSSAILIQQKNLTIEMVPTERRNSQLVWQSLLYNMPIGSMIRNLNKFSSVRLFDNKQPEHIASERNIGYVNVKLLDTELLRKARVHPVDLFIATQAYERGNNMNMRWEVYDEILENLKHSLSSLLNVDSKEVNENVRVLIAIDHSGSMDTEVISNTSCFEAAVMMATYIKSKFTKSTQVVFSSNMVIGKLNLTNDVYSNVRQAMKSPSTGATSCADPIVWAKNNKENYDAIVILTDSETWAGNENVRYAIGQYRDKINSKMRFVNVAMVGNTFTLADPMSNLDMEMTSFDTGIVNVIESFISGESIWEQEK